MNNSLHLFNSFPELTVLKLQHCHINAGDCSLCNLNGSNLRALGREDRVLSRKFCWQNSQHRRNRPSLLHDPGRLPVLQGPISEHKDPKKTTNKKTHSEHSLNPSLQKRTRITWKICGAFFFLSHVTYTHIVRLGLLPYRKSPTDPREREEKRKRVK